MISLLFRLLLVSVLLASALASGAPAARPGAAQGAPTATPFGGGPPAPVTTPPLPTLTPTPLPVPPPNACHRHSAGNRRLFPETGQTAGGDFINYWERHGGLAQQGFPISPLIEEVSDLDGTSYQVQYFERAVFECHPENLGNQYAILLAQLGTYQYRQKYPQGAPGQRPNGENPLFFPETGKTLGGEFRAYWEAHGGKRQQGLPLSEEFTEVSPLDGKSYTVQYFERAVFEYHPENVPPYRVLLSQLGTLRYRAKYPAPPGPPPVPLPTPDPTGPRFLGYTSPNSLVGGGGLLFWRDAHGPWPNEAPLGYDVTTQRQLGTAQTRDLRLALTTDGRTAAWMETRSNGTYAIHGYDLRTGREFPLLPLAAPVTLAAVSDDTAYYIYSEAGTGGSELQAHHWPTGQTTRITSLPANSYLGRVAASSGYVAWVEQNLEPPQVGRLYLAPTNNPAGARLISTGSFSTVAISDDRLLWTQYVRQPDGSYNERDSEVQMYTISTRATQVLERGVLYQLSVSENHAAWQVWEAYPPSGAPHMVVLDLGTGQRRDYDLPVGTSTALLAGAALAYIQAISGSDRSELYLQPLP